MSPRISIVVWGDSHLAAHHHFPRHFERLRQHVPGLEVRFEPGLTLNAVGGRQMSAGFVREFVDFLRTEQQGDPFIHIVLLGSNTIRHWYRKGAKKFSRLEDVYAEVAVEGIASYFGEMVEAVGATDKTGLVLVSPLPSAYPEHDVHHRELALRLRELADTQPECVRYVKFTEGLDFLSPVSQYDPWLFQDDVHLNWHGARLLAFAILSGARNFPNRLFGLPHHIRASKRARAAAYQASKRARLEAEAEAMPTSNYPPLTTDILAYVDALWVTHQEVIVEDYGITIGPKDLASLKSPNWVNDQAINFFLEMVQERSLRSDNLPRVQVLTTFFMPRLLDFGYAKVSRWTRNIDVFAADLVFFPLHLGAHWTLLVVDFRTRSIRYYDSMHSRRGLYYLRRLLGWLVKEHKAKKKNYDFDKDSFSLVVVESCPKQNNGFDCGVFMLQFAEHLSRDAPLAFSQQQMPYFRSRITFEIAVKQLM